MKIAEVRKSVGDLRLIINVAQAQIERIQSACKHPPGQLSKVAKSNTGNWSPSDDSYWYECDCAVCGKHWNEDQ